MKFKRKKPVMRGQSAGRAPKHLSQTRLPQLKTSGNIAASRRQRLLRIAAEFIYAEHATHARDPYRKQIRIARHPRTNSRLVVIRQKNGKYGFLTVVGGLEKWSWNYASEDDAHRVGRNRLLDRIDAVQGGGQCGK